jgi:hypothetical protein
MSVRLKRRAGRSSSSITRKSATRRRCAGRAGHDETIFRISGSLEDGTHEFSFPIDSTVESAFISVSLQCLQVVEIATPAGALYAIRIPAWTTTSSRPGASSR